MKIVSLHPYITELLIRFGQEDSLVGVSSECVLSEGISELERVAQPGSAQSNRVAISDYDVDFEKLAQLEPDLILGMPDRLKLEHGEVMKLQQELRQVLNEQVRYRGYYPRTLDQVYEFFEKLGKDAGVPAKGLDLSQRLKAQAMNWCDNFYSRMKNKRVCVLSGVDPLMLAGFWVPDMVRLCSAIPQYLGGEEAERPTSWNDIQEFRPDVLLVAPKGMELEESQRLFVQLEKLPGWDDLIAVKRGDVFFAGGDRNFYVPTGALFTSLGILISCIAGFDSGYITERDSFFRLRFLEMHRHKL